ncbi:MAG: outer membrane beta-barrel protein [Muribaculaceae bacterium]|nr:outer membrane beta-barrel protein [Muribaculaceae bacterium]MDE6135205.1 outer membrane beta-barrel protein [Muribaculaceae bacterium]
MKRLYFLFTFMLLSAGVFTTYAQEEIFDNASNRAHFGVRLGLDVSCPGKINYNDIPLAGDAFNNGVGFQLIGIYNIPLWKNLYFEPGLGIYYNTQRYNLEWLGLILSDTSSASVRRFGFRVPFVAGYRFDFEPFSVSVFTGPELNVGLVGRNSITTAGKSHSENAYANDGDFHRAGLGWKFGAGFRYDRYVFEVSGTVGMTNMIKGVDGKYHDNNVAFTVGYNF